MRMTAAFSCSFILSLLLLENASSENAYLGCFFDKFDSQTRVLPVGDGIHYSDMTVGKCINQCLDFPNDARYAGVETGSQCWCGTQDADYDQYGRRPDNECRAKPCTGDMNQYCGADFKIAVYDLFLVGCQLPDLANSNVDSSPGDFVPVRMFVTFTCLPGYVLNGTDTAQCIIGDSTNDIGWDRQLPVCKTAATFATSTARTTVPRTEDGTSSMMSPIIKKTPLSSTITIAGIAGGAGLLLVVIAILIILICVRKRNQKKNNSLQGTVQTQNNNDVPHASTVGLVNNEQSAENAYRVPAVQSPTSSSVAIATSQIQHRKQPKVQAYAYTDVSINPPKFQMTDRPIGGKPSDHESGWTDNSIYTRTDENAGFGVNDEEGWEDNTIYVTSSH